MHCRCVCCFYHGLKFLCFKLAKAKVVHGERRRKGKDIVFVSRLSYIQACLQCFRYINTFTFDNRPDVGRTYELSLVGHNPVPFKIHCIYAFKPCHLFCFANVLSGQHLTLNIWSVSPMPQYRLVNLCYGRQRNLVFSNGHIVHNHTSSQTCP